jgi:hypothetical protein
MDQPAASATPSAPRRGWRIWHVAAVSVVVAVVLAIARAVLSGDNPVVVLVPGVLLGHLVARRLLKEMVFDEASVQLSPGERILIGTMVYVPTAVISLLVYVVVIEIVAEALSPWLR